MLQEGTCGLGFGVCGCNTTEQLMLILWWLTSRESSFIESTLQTKISDNNPKWAILYHTWTRRFSLHASEQEDDSFRESSVSDFPLPRHVSVIFQQVYQVLDMKRHLSESMYVKPTDDSYNALGCIPYKNWNVMETSCLLQKLRWLLMVNRKADPGKKLQTQVGGKSKRHGSFSSSSDSSWGNSSPIGSFGASCKNIHTNSSNELVNWCNTLLKDTIIVPLLLWVWTPSSNCYISILIPWYTIQYDHQNDIHDAVGTQMKISFY